VRKATTSFSSGVRSAYERVAVDVELLEDVGSEAVQEGV
jgi:hypothetical protein